jgi:hypothetical protein
VCSSTPIRLAAEIERGDGPLTGRIIDEHGSRRDFVGWTGLAAVLTAILADAEADQTSGGDRSQPEAQ